jgi:hypothetical protein
MCPDLRPPSVPKPSPSPWLGALPTALRLCDVVATFFGAPRRINSVRPSNVPGSPNGRVLLSARGNITHGFSGGGRTTLLRVIGRRARGASELATSTDDRADYGRLPGGQVVMAVEKILLAAMPRDGCPLVDDALRFLDLENFDLFVAALVESDRQVVMAAEDRHLEQIRTAFGPDAHRFDMAEPPGWAEAVRLAEARR